MKSLIKCSHCNEKFEIYDVLISNKSKKFIQCKSCKKKFVPKNIVYKRLYEFFIVPWVVVYVNMNMKMEGIMVYISILITILILNLFFDLVPHKFNKYIGK